MRKDGDTVYSVSVSCERSEIVRLLLLLLLLPELPATLHLHSTPTLTLPYPTVCPDTDSHVLQTENGIIGNGGAFSPGECDEDAPSASIRASFGGRKERQKQNTNVFLQSQKVHRWKVSEKHVLAGCHE